MGFLKEVISVVIPLRAQESLKGTEDNRNPGKWKAIEDSIGQGVSLKMILLTSLENKM